MDLLDDGIDITSSREGVEMDACADGSTPFRVVRWLDDAPEPITGDDWLQEEFMSAVQFWKGE